jgi:predicted secreted protein
MATHKGSEGTVKVGANAIAEVRSFSISETGDTIEDTTMGDAARTYKPSLTSWSGSVEVYWDETDTNGQVALTVGAEVTLNVYPEGSTTGDSYLTGSAIVTGRTINSSFDGMVEASITVQGNGALTADTVS